MVNPGLFRRSFRLGSHRALDGDERLFCRSRLGTARLRQVGATAATLTTQRFGAETHQLYGIEAAG